MLDETDLVVSRIVGLVAEQMLHLETVTGTSRIRELGLDSVAVMDLILAVEDEFDFIFPLERLAETETIDDLARIVRSLMDDRRARP